MRGRTGAKPQRLFEIVFLSAIGIVSFLTLIHQMDKTEAETKVHAEVDCTNIEQEKSISAAINYYIKYRSNSWLIINNESGSSDSYKLYVYESVEDFLSKNPNCCSFDFNVARHTNPEDSRKHKYCAIVGLSASQDYIKDGLWVRNTSRFGGVFAIGQNYEIYDATPN